MATNNKPNDDSKLSDEELKKQNKAKLSDGRIAKVKALRGKDALQAQARCDGKPDEYSAILMSMATEIDGKQAVKEDVEEMPAKDFNAIFAIHSDLNF